MYETIFINYSPSLVFPSRPVGPHRLATELRKNGISSYVFDHVTIFSESEIEKILMKLVSKNTLFIGFSTTFALSTSEDKKIEFISGEVRTAGLSLVNSWEWPFSVSRDFLLRLKRNLLQINPNLKFILGGSRSYIRNTADLSFIDLIIDGYADQTIVEVANNLKKINSSYKLNSTFHCGTYVYNHDVKQSAFNFSNSTTSYLESNFLTSKDTLAFEVARGCIFKCGFCSYPLNGKQKMDFIKDKEILKDELTFFYEKFGVSRYIIGDDTFNDSTQKLEEFLGVIQSLKFKPTFSSYVRLELLRAHPEQVELLKEIGIKGASFGLETLDPSVAKVIKKNPKHMQNTLERCREIWKDDVLITGNFIFGLPGDKFENFSKTIDWVVENNNLVDFVALSTLGISKYKIWKSEFDSNYEKYGYTEIPAPQQFPPSQIYWKHSEGYNYGNVYTFVKSQEPKLSKILKISAFDLQAALAFGFTTKELRTTPIVDILESPKWISGLNDYFLTYKKNILEYIENL